MSDALYPSDLPGITYGTTRSVLAPPVRVRTTPSQREYRSRSATLTRYGYTLVYNFLRASAARAELQRLVGFYNARGGPFDSFLFQDVDDCTAAAEPFGVGNGTLRTFQLLRSMGGFVEPVDAVAAGAVIKVGSTVTAVTFSGGLVTFASAPAAAAALTWSGTFYRRVRFDGDKLDTTRFMRQLYEAKRVQLIATRT